MENLVKKTQKTQQSTRDLLNKHKRWTLSCEGSGGAAPGDTLKKALQTFLVSITFYISEGVRT